MRPRPAPAPPMLARWAGLLLTVAAIGGLAVLLRDLDWSGLLQPLTSARLEWLAIATGLALGVELAKTLRWQLLLGLPPATLPSLLAIVLNARLLNMLAPARAGDVWRVTAAISQERRSLLTAGGSLVLEKALDGVLLGGLGLAVLGMGRLDWLPLLLAGSAALAGALVASRPVRTLLLRAAAQLRHLQSVPAVASTVALTLAGLALGLLANLAVLHALAAPADILVGLVMLVAGYAVGLAPAGPGRLGVYELALTAPLVGVGLSSSTAFAAAVALHAVLIASLLLGELLAAALHVAAVVAAGRVRAEEVS